MLFLDGWMGSLEAALSIIGWQENIARFVFSTYCLADHSSCASRDPTAKTRRSGRAALMCLNLCIFIVVTFVNPRL